MVTEQVTTGVGQSENGHAASPWLLAAEGIRSLWMRALRGVRSLEDLDRFDTARGGPHLS